MRFLKRYISQIFGFLGVAWLIYEILNALNIFSFDASRTTTYLLYISAAFLIIFLLNILIFIKAKRENIQPDKAFIQHMKDRIGSMKSLEVSEGIDVDNTHEYILIHRQDYLNCSGGHYYSVRRLVGFNATSNISGGLVYSESTEFKIPYENIKVTAFDCITKKQLLVTPLIDKDKPVSTHTFKINFEKPIGKKEKFDIVYSIFLPNELRCLHKNDEVMSISLVRIKKKIHNLRFNLCLDFSPNLLRLYSMKGESRYKMLKNSASISEYLIDDDKFKSYGFGIEWPVKPYIVNWLIRHPKDKLYIIQYFK